jgi:DNA-binding transcriptional ArsR family regulator
MSELAEVFEVDDAETFEMLADPTRVELIERLFEPATVSELAEAMDVPRTRLYHHIRLLAEVGMIRVVQTRQRGAIPEKVYQATAKDYQASEKFLATYPPRQAAAAMVDTLFATTRADIVRAAAEGRFDLERDPRQRRGMMIRHLVALSPRRRDEFFTELKALLDRYQDDDPDGEPLAATMLVYASSRKRRR